MKTKNLLTLLAGAAALAATSAQAAVINIADYTLVPDGTTYGTVNNNDPGVVEGQVTNVSALNGGAVLPTGSSPFTSTVYMITTFSFGANSLADIQINFAASVGQDRLGVKVTNDGKVSSIGDGSDSSNNFDFYPSTTDTMEGQTVTVLLELLYDVDRNTSNANDTLINYWVNPTGSSTASGGVPGGDFNSIWNSAGFVRLEQRILNKSTPGTAGASSITDTVILTGADATWANALAAIPEPSAALLGGLGLLALLRRRRS